MAEAEIQQDYSKYVNEYGLTKTAFAKAVNALREKQERVPSSQRQMEEEPISDLYMNTKSSNQNHHIREIRSIKTSMPTSNIITTLQSQRMSPAKDLFGPSISNLLLVQPEKIGRRATAKSKGKMNSGSQKQLKVRVSSRQQKSTFSNN